MTVSWLLDKELVFEADSRVFLTGLDTAGGDIFFASDDDFVCVAWRLSMSGDDEEILMSEDDLPACDDDCVPWRLSTSDDDEEVLTSEDEDLLTRDDDCVPRCLSTSDDDDGLLTSEDEDLLTWDDDCDRSWWARCLFGSVADDDDWCGLLLLLRWWWSLWPWPSCFTSTWQWPNLGSAEDLCELWPWPGFGSPADRWELLEWCLWASDFRRSLWPSVDLDRSWDEWDLWSDDDDECLVTDVEEWWDFDSCTKCT